MAHVEAQLDGGRDLVDVLAAGAGGADKALLQLVVVNRKGVVDVQHGWDLAEFPSR